MDGISDAIVPFGLLGNEIVDLSSVGWDEKLERKLTGEDKYVLAPVAKIKKKFGIEPIADFQPIKPAQIISIDSPQAIITSSSISGGYYRSVNFDLTLKFKNISSKPIENFAYSIAIKPQMLEESQIYSLEDGYGIINKDISKRLLPSQSISDIIKLFIQSHNVKSVLNSNIKITAYTDYGPIGNEFQLADILKIRNNPTQSFSQLVPLNPNLFIDLFGNLL